MGTAIDMAFDGATLAACPLSALVLSFAFYGFCGWAWESTVCAMLNHGRFANSGFLLGPCCPIYGAGGIACWLLLRGIPDASSQFVAAACSLASWRRLSDQLERVRADLADRINESLADASDSMLERIPDSAIDSVAQTHIRGRAVNAWLAELGDAALDALREKASMPTFISDGARGLALAARRVADAAPSMPRPSLSRRLAGKRMSRPVPSVSLSRRDLRFFNAFPRLRINRYEGVIRATDLRDRARELFRR